MKMFGKEVGPGNPVLIIAEAGINHNGDFKTALEMIDAAKQAGADVVKFQKRNMPTLYRSDALRNPSEMSHGLGVYIPILKRCEFPNVSHLKLKEKCERIGMKYLCSPWDIESVDFLESIGVEAYKVPSACLSDIYLMDRLAATNKPVIISTGMHSETETHRFINRYKEIMPDRLAVLHCVSSYPTANKDVNIKFMQKLTEVHGLPTGYSGHEKGVPITVAAVALGACIVERHFTLDRTMPGPDHAASLEPHGLETLIRHIRAVEEALGNVKKINQGEVIARETLGKVLTWARSHKKGDEIGWNSFKATSPGYGIPAGEATNILNNPVEKRVAVDVEEDEAVKRSHIEWEEE